MFRIGATAARQRRFRRRAPGNTQVNPIRWSILSYQHAFALFGSAQDSDRMDRSINAILFGSLCPLFTMRLPIVIVQNTKNAIQWVKRGDRDDSKSDMISSCRCLRSLSVFPMGYSRWGWCQGREVVGRFCSSCFSQAGTLPD